MTHEYSKLPSSVLPTRKFLDVTDTIASIVNTIKELQAAGKYEDVASKVQEYQSQGIDLTDYIVDSSFMNLLDEEIINLELFCKSRKQSVFYSDEEPLAETNDVWICGDDSGLYGNDSTTIYIDVTHKGF